MSRKCCGSWSFNHLTLANAPTPQRPNAPTPQRPNALAMQQNPLSQDEGDEVVDGLRRDLQSRGH